MWRATDLADVFRAAGLEVHEEVVPDWRLRSRQGGRSWYSIEPRYVHQMDHDTATKYTSHDTDDEIRRMVWSLAAAQADAPICNFATDKFGRIWMIAAGPSNTNGKGADWWNPLGSPERVPLDSMNSRAIANEVMNDGIGEPWTQATIDACLTANAAVCRLYGTPTHLIRAHHEWAPTRKIDMSSGASVNRYAIHTGPDARYGKFDMNLWRSDVAARLAPAPPPLTPIPPYVIPEGDEMITGLWKGPNDPGVYQVCSNRTKIWCYPGTVDEAQALLRLEGKSDAINVQTSAEMFRAFGPVVGPRPAGVDEYGWK